MEVQLEQKEKEYQIISLINCFVTDVERCSELGEIRKSDINPMATYKQFRFNVLKWYLLFNTESR